MDRLHKSAGGMLLLSLRIWSIHWLLGRPGRRLQWKCRPTNTILHVLTLFTNPEPSKFPTQYEEEDCSCYVVYIILMWHTCRSCDIFITFSRSKFPAQCDQLSQCQMGFLLVFWIPQILCCFSATACISRVVWLAWMHKCHRIVSFVCFSADVLMSSLYIFMQHLFGRVSGVDFIALVV